MDKINIPSKFCEYCSPRLNLGDQLFSVLMIHVSVYHTMVIEQSQIQDIDIGLNGLLSA